MTESDWALVSASLGTELKCSLSLMPWKRTLDNILPGLLAFHCHLKVSLPFFCQRRNQVNRGSGKHDPAGFWSPDSHDYLLLRQTTPWWLMLFHGVYFQGIPSPGQKEGTTWKWPQTDWNTFSHCKNPLESTVEWRKTTSPSHQPGRLAQPAFILNFNNLDSNPSGSPQR